MLKEFKAFAMKGNVIDLAVGVIIGGAFGKIVTSLVNDVIMPLVGLLLGGIDLSSDQLHLREESYLKYGSFIQTILDFLIIAFSIFLFVRLLQRFRKKEESKPVESTPSKEELLLTEIRDLLKQQQERQN
ncbi:large conductance mechanosensitive channel protein MscL [Fredinandcohnia quinoae]|uniref:Large-conductance mechanosensitive channel n=1 Tax=Fredinandcohnia quinoae TaxID=2918902 RepID=A0AAW5E5E1_9BACI|nr:large conductance mechanosensitive channel protein MscL [Fredinandcohnia sp. SECRCQ15]MCH1623994.1 large conductance mechanosensitive channel protein MscL [Fredinandcohnia sp. SECRCQ15]